ncbi:MAG: glycoside hydrolase family 18 protein, partial [Bacteroidota bacterium]
MKFFRQVAPVVVLLLAMLFISNSPKKQKEQPIVVIAYYVPEKDYHPELLPLDQLTHIIFSFTHVIDGEMKFQDAENKKKLQQLVAQREKHPQLKVMIACGGWGADGFSDMASTAENRKKFVESVVAFNKEFKLDGVDIDWEYPAIPAAGTGARPEDKQNFTLLMRELRAALNTLDRKQILTFASAGWKRYYKNIELESVMNEVDYMNIMTYDQVGPSSPFTGHHTPLGYIQETDIADTPAAEFIEEFRKSKPDSDRDYGPRSAEKIVQFCLDQGIKPEQLVIGAAFYGRAWKGVPPNNNGLYEKNSGAHIAWSAYHQIREEFESNEAYKRYWDSTAKAPYLYNAKDSIFISYGYGIIVTD